MASEIFVFDAFFSSQKMIVSQRRITMSENKRNVRHLCMYFMKFLIVALRENKKQYCPTLLLSAQLNMPNEFNYLYLSPSM